jgi:crotonobetainyl-CoA:carnitine CoA-transferase CaiB-like acyl-CoA transferase
MTAPLDGIRVLEIANYVAAPALGALMRDLGADVIKAEPPGGEVMRASFTPGTGAYHVNFLFELENRGKRSMTLALGTSEATELVHELLANCDVLLTNLLAPRQERFGLTFEQVHARNPHIIHCSISGFGLEGPDASRPGFDFTAFWARAGIMGLVGHPGAEPVLSRIAQGDHTAAMNALAAVFAALRMRDLTGKGQAVDISLQQTGVYTVATDVARTLMDGKQPKKLDRRAPNNPLFNTYETADGEWVLLVHMTPDPYWPKVCAAIDRSDLVRDEYATLRQRMEHGAALAAEIQSAIGARDLAHWQERFDDQALIWAPMAALPDVVKDAALRGRDAFPTVEHPDGPFETVGVPFRIVGAEIGPRGRSPEPGEHTQAVLAELGISEARVAELAAAGVFG